MYNFIMYMVENNAFRISMCAIAIMPYIMLCLDRHGRCGLNEEMKIRHTGLHFIRKALQKRISHSILIHGLWAAVII